MRLLRLSVEAVGGGRWRWGRWWGRCRWQRWPSTRSGRYPSFRAHGQLRTEARTNVLHGAGRVAPTPRCWTVSTNGSSPCLQAQRCSELTDLNLSWCNQLTDLGCERLAAGCPLIKKLDLTCCSLVGDAGIESLAAACRIVELNLHGCRRLTDAALAVFGERLDALEVLNVGFCNQLSDTGFAALTCGRLGSLVAKACPWFTDDGLTAVA